MMWQHNCIDQMVPIALIILPLPPSDHCQLVQLQTRLKVSLDGGLVTTPFAERNTVDKHFFNLRRRPARRFWHDEIGQDCAADMNDHSSKHSRNTGADKQPDGPHIPLGKHEGDYEREHEGIGVAIGQPVRQLKDIYSTHPHPAAFDRKRI